MKKSKIIKTILTATVIIAINQQSFALDRFVTNPNDNYQEGTLRAILYEACEDEGDDTIIFDENGSEFRIDMNDVFVIPEDCNGRVFLQGSAETNAVLNGESIDIGGNDIGDSCLLYVYSNNNSVSHMSFIGNSNGAGLCVFGQNNVIKNNYFGVTAAGQELGNRFGIVVSNIFSNDFPEGTGANAQIEKNTVSSNQDSGIWIQAEGLVATGNQIFQNGAYGIFIQEDSRSITIGTPDGEQFSEKHNTIFENESGGIAIEGNTYEQAITISHNLIFENNGLAIDLNGDGDSDDDYRDLDQGANGTLNRLSNLQAFPIGNDSYWIFGATPYGSRAELYQVSAQDAEFQDYSGGYAFLQDVVLNPLAFETTVALSPGDIITALIFDESGNTSEYALNVILGSDQDLDGILDDLEAGANQDSSSADQTDSDGDGLPDSVEDKNRNGIWDIELGESSAFLSDSDGDSISDWIELHGKDISIGQVDSSPLEVDSDGDGLNDGDEDTNQNGIWEGYLGETHPARADSDLDGVLDSQDNCPIFPNPSQIDGEC